MGVHAHCIAHCGHCGIALTIARIAESISRIAGIARSIARIAGFSRAIARITRIARAIARIARSIACIALTIAGCALLRLLRYLLQSLCELLRPLRGL